MSLTSMLSSLSFYPLFRGKKQSLPSTTYSTTTSHAYSLLPLPTLSARRRKTRPFSASAFSLSLLHPEASSRKAPFPHQHQHHTTPAPPPMPPVPQHQEDIDYPKPRWRTPLVAYNNISRCPQRITVGAEPRHDTTPLHASKKQHNTTADPLRGGRGHHARYRTSTAALAPALGSGRLLPSRSLPRM